MCLSDHSFTHNFFLFHFVEKPTLEFREGQFTDTGSQGRTNSIPNRKRRQGVSERSKRPPTQSLQVMISFCLRIFEISIPN